MIVTIVGCGAMGSVYAALFAEAGHEVWAVDTWDEHVAEIRENGLRIEGASGDRTVRNVNAAMQLPNTPPADLTVIATKADGVRAACESVRDHLKPDGLVLTMQNGIGASETAVELLPAEAFLVGIAKGFGASVISPGRVHHHAMAEIRIGEQGGGDTGRGRSIAKIWSDAGFNANFYPDIDRLIWEKFICNVTLSAPCTAFGKTAREVRTDPDLWRIAKGCGLEAYAVGVAMGISFGFDDAEAFITEFAENLLDARPSMALDHLANRKSEIDFINGRVPILAEKVGVPTPYNDAMSAVVRNLEIKF